MRDSFPVVGLGASAGGLDAARRLLAALPASTGMAFILIQHLDPTHASMMVDLLAGHTPMPVQQAADGMPLEREHVYLIPPGTYLSIGAGALRLSEPRERHGARLPFDFFLRSLAEELGERAICVILSGTGGDGSLGLKAVKEKGGLVIVQDPDDAEYDGMPRSAMLTGAVDLVLPVAKIPEILAKYGRRKGLAPDDHPPDRLTEVVDLLRTNTSHDFSLYKPGTLLRRIERLFRPQQQRLPAILTHELSHAHIQGWIGETAYILRLPNWFKEGLRRGRQRATGVMLLTVSGGQER